MADVLAGTLDPSPVFGYAAMHELVHRLGTRRVAVPAQGALTVTFEPGARTAWHTHPLGQHLLITSGIGWVQQQGRPIREVRTGDVVWFPPGVKHWHGASPTNAMTHLAIQEARNGSAVEWLEHVSDEQYRKGARSETRPSGFDHHLTTGTKLP